MPHFEGKIVAGAAGGIGEQVALRVTAERGLPAGPEFNLVAADAAGKQVQIESTSKDATVLKGPCIISKREPGAGRSTKSPRKSVTEMRRSRPAN